MAVCMSVFVCLSVTLQNFATSERLSWRRLPIALTYPYTVLFFRRYVSTFVPNSGLQKISPGKVDRVVVKRLIDSRGYCAMCWTVDVTLTARTQFTTCWSTVIVLLWIYCTTCSYSCSAVDIISTDSASRGPSATADRAS